MIPSELHFKNWLGEQGLTEGWLTKAASRAALALAIGAGVAWLAGMQSQRQPPAQVAPVAQQEDNQKAEFIRRINAEYRLNIRPDQVEYIRPSDVIKPMWEEKWGDVLSKAKASQEFEKIGGEERPAIIQGKRIKISLVFQAFSSDIAMSLCSILVKTIMGV